MTDPLKLTASLDRPRIARGQPALVHLVAELTAPQAAAERPPLRLVLALDTSGSIEGEKLRHVVSSVQLLLQQLKPHDRVGIVAFAHAARPLAPLSTPSAARHALLGLRAEGGTNVEAGLRLATSMLGPRGGETRDAVLLLSDGQPNAGAMTPRTLTDVVRQLGLAVSTLGYGEDHAEDVLIAMSEAGRGTYAYVPRPELCRVELARAVGARAEVVAEGVTLSLEPRRGVTVDGPSQVTLPDFLAGERRPVAFALKLAGHFDPGNVTLARLVMRQRPAHVVELDVAAEVRDTAGPLDPRAHGLRLCCSARETRMRAATLADGSRFDEAKAELEHVIEEIRRAPVDANSAELSEALEQLIDDVALMQQRPDAPARAAFRRGQQAMPVRTAMAAAALTNVPKARLVILEGTSPAEVPLRGDMVLGRTASADLQLQSDSVSRMHTRITASDGAFWVNDLGSSNGTLLNGKPVRCERLRDGDVLHVGRVKLLYREAR